MAGGGWASAGLSGRAETLLMNLTKSDSPELQVALRGDVVEGGVRGALGSGAG